MSRAVAEDHSADNTTPYHSMEIGSSLTLGQLLKNVSDVRKVDVGDETPLHSSQGDQDYDDLMRPVPFVLSFNNLTYNNENQTEFALDLIRELEGSAGGTRGLVEFNKRWQEMKNLSPPASPNPNLTLKEAISASISRGKLVSGGGGGGGSSVASHGGFANPFWIEIKTLTERSILNSRRQPELFGTRLATVLVTGFILATVFWRSVTSS
ncbi:hypothetical protein Bca52824_047190 [Brassica carinata]|uniref:Uncharacterized protein n=1 Tax=Brassica carinata TaxID=52824 RepID=A0A8X7UT33_BRACI|nr:hypothetical protein Bca52824_047190 [Brassica carinata]